MEWLKELLGETLFSQVKAILDEKKVKIGNIGDGSYIPKDKFDNKIEEIKLLNEKIKIVEENQKNVEKLVEDKLSKSHKEELEKLQKDFDDKLGQKDKEILNGNKTSLITALLNKNKAQYPELILKTIDLDEIKIEKNELVDFDMEKLKSTYPNMFEKTEISGQTDPTKSPLGQKSTTMIQTLKTKYNELAKDTSLSPTEKVTRMAIVRRQINEAKNNKE
jgi:hypothetical protein